MFTDFFVTLWIHLKIKLKYLNLPRPIQQNQVFAALDLHIKKYIFNKNYYGNLQQRLLEYSKSTFLEKAALKNRIFHK